MHARNLAAMCVAAALLAGCVGPEEPAGPGAGNGTTNTTPPLGNGTTNGTGGTTNGTTNTTTPPPNSTFEPVNGTETVRPTSGVVKVDVDEDASALNVTFRAKGLLGAASITSFAAQLKDPDGAVVATADSLDDILQASDPQEGEWTIEVQMTAPPTESVEVKWEQM